MFLFGKKFSMKDLQQIMEEKKVKVIDVRTKQEYEEGHIEGAVNIPMDKIEDTFEEFFPKKEEDYYFYCHSGARSAMVSNYLKSMGYSNCHNVGSFLRWKGRIEK